MGKNSTSVSVSIDEPPLAENLKEYTYIKFTLMMSSGTIYSGTCLVNPMPLMAESTKPPIMPQGTTHYHGVLHTIKRKIIDVGVVVNTL